MNPVEQANDVLGRINDPVPSRRPSLIEIAGVLSRLRTEFERLETERDRLGDAAYAAYVEIGADTDGARNWAELFRPITFPSWAEVLGDEVRTARTEYEAEIDRLEALENR